MFCLTVCICVLHVFFFDMYAYLYLYVVRFLLEEQKRAICITETDQFTSSCTWNYYGSYSNQHDIIITRVLKGCSGLRFEVQQLIE